MKIKELAEKYLGFRLLQVFASIGFYPLAIAFIPAVLLGLNAYSWKLLTVPEAVNTIFGYFFVFCLSCFYLGYLVSFFLVFLLNTVGKYYFVLGTARTRTKVYLKTGKKGEKMQIVFTSLIALLFTILLIGIVAVTIFILLRNV